MAETFESTVTAEADQEDEMTWNDLTVPQLKEELSLRGLETAGKKAELVARLEKYDSDMLAQHKQEEDNGDEFVVWNVDEDVGEDRDDHDDVEYLGTSSDGTKADGQDGMVADAGKDKEDAAEKPAAADADSAAKELEPDFTVTPSKEKDMLLLMWCGKQVPVPFRDEVQKDVRHCSRLQNVMMYPVELADVLSDTFRPLIESAINVSTELDEIVAGQAVKGYLRLKFSSPSEAARAVDTLKEYKREGLELTIKFFAEDDSEGHVLSKIRKDEAERKGPLITRLLYVGNLPAGIAEEALKECFPDALRAIVPSSTEKEDATEKSGGYAYMEYVSEADATEAVKRYQDVELDGHRLYVIRAMTERMMSFGLLKDSLRKYWLEQIRGMEASKAKAVNKTPREQADIDSKLERMKRRIKKDNERRELLNIPVPDSEVMEVTESDTEKMMTRRRPRTTSPRTREASPRSTTPAVTTGLRTDVGRHRDVGRVHRDTGLTVVVVVVVVTAVVQSATEAVVKPTPIVLLISFKNLSASLHTERETTAGHMVVVVVVVVATMMEDLLHAAVEVVATVLLATEVIITRQVVGFHRNDRLIPTIQTERDMSVMTTMVVEAVAAMVRMVGHDAADTTRWTTDMRTAAGQDVAHYHVLAN